MASRLPGKAVEQIHDIVVVEVPVVLVERVSDIDDGAPPLLEDAEGEAGRSRQHPVDGLTTADGGAPQVAKRVVEGCPHVAQTSVVRRVPTQPLGQASRQRHGCSTKVFLMCSGDRYNLYLDTVLEALHPQRHKPKGVRHNHMTGLVNRDVAIEVLGPVAVARQVSARQVARDFGFDFGFNTQQHAGDRLVVPGTRQATLSTPGSRSLTL